MNWKRIQLIASVVIVVGVVLFFGVVFTSLYGGVSGLFLSLIPEPNWQSQSITLAKNNKEKEIKLMLDEIGNKLSWNYAGSLSSSICVKGDHTWKRNDSFAYECNLRVTEYYSFESDFREKMVEVDRVLVQQGWKASWKPMNEMLRAYYDDLKNSNYGKTRMVSVLPGMTYEYIDEAKSYTFLSIDYAQRETPDKEIYDVTIGDYPAYNEVYSERSSADKLEIFHKATKNDKYFISISTSRIYFRR